MIKQSLKSLKDRAKLLRRFICQRNFIASKLEKNTIRRFHKLYYRRCYKGNRAFWLGAYISKCPLDTWIYQEIISELKPDIIIESGTGEGGSALFLASMCDLINHGEIVTIDVQDIKARPEHERIKQLFGSSLSEEILQQLRTLISDKNKVMVILDSDHHKEHVLKELQFYSQFVTKDSYLIVEDTNVNGHPVRPDYGPGPMEAVEEFLKENSNFAVDKSKEKFFVTFNPNGFLKKLT